MTSLISYTQKVMITFVLAVFLTACGGGSSGGDSSNSSTTPPPGGGGSGSTPTTGSATLSWTPPTENTDGSSLGTDLSGYKIYYGTTQSSLDTSIELTNSGLTEYVIDNLTAGTTYYFAITAVNDSSIESAYSNIVSKNITG